jgi:hypothetical protein
MIYDDQIAVEVEPISKFRESAPFVRQDREEIASVARKLMKGKARVHGCDLACSLHWEEGDLPFKEIERELSDIAGSEITLESIHS